MLCCKGKLRPDCENHKLLALEIYSEDKLVMENIQGLGPGQYRPS